MTHEYRYACLNRPPGFATVPKGSIRYEPHPDFRHGVVVYERPLLPEDARAYELKYLPTEEEVEQCVQAIADAIQYPTEALDLAKDDPLAFEQQVGYAWECFPLFTRRPDAVLLHLPTPRATLARRVLAALAAKHHWPTPR